MCNHHLIGKWSRVQTGKGKAWLKPTHPHADNPPAWKAAQAELGGAGALQTHSPSQHWQTQQCRRGARAGIVTEDFPVCWGKQSRCWRFTAVNPFLLTNKRQSHQEKPRNECWALSSVQQWQQCLCYSKTAEPGHGCTAQRVRQLLQEQMLLQWWLQWHLKPCHCSRALQASLGQSIQLTALTKKKSTFTLRPFLTGWSFFIVIVVVFIFIIYIAGLLLVDSHLHMSENERNHLITCFSHQLWNRANNLLSTSFSSFFLYVWFTISCQLQAGRIIF